jgi:hypothetical protein
MTTSNQPPPERKPDPKRLEALRQLPADVLKSLTKEEINTFLYADDWPDSLRKKLERYIADDYQSDRPS